MKMVVIGMSSQGFFLQSNLQLHARSEFEEYRYIAETHRICDKGIVTRKLVNHRKFHL